MEPEPILNIVGEKVALGPHRRDLLPLYQRWLNDFEVLRTLGTLPRPMTLEQETEWFERASRDARDSHFVIYERETLRPIGGTSLEDVDPHHGTATFGIFIGDKDCWGKGYGTEATRLLIEYGFTDLGLHNIMLQVYSYNERGLRAYLRAGFKEIGRRRGARKLEGERYDIVYMDCTPADFNPASTERPART